MGYKPRRLGRSSLILYIFSESIKQMKALIQRLSWQIIPLGKIYRLCQSNGLIFAVAMWLLSRGVIIIAMLGIAPLLPAPPGGIQAEVGWGVFSAWDSHYYHELATVGYDYANNTIGGNVAFFPLFPLALRAVMLLGLPFEVAGTLINNLAFLGALIVLYGWVEVRHGTRAARWATAVLAWCPLSLFGTVIYTEGLFLFFSTAALRAFDNQQYTWTALWGTLATATRITGLALIPAFLITAWRKRKSALAYLAGLASGGGVLLYSLYCWIHFRDPLAFINVQHSVWKRSSGVDWLGWGKMLMQITVGTANWEHGSIKDPWHPLLFLLICGCGYLLWRFRQQLGSAKFDCGLIVLAFLLWLLAGDPLLNTVMVLGGGYLIWHLRRQLSLLSTIYGFCALGLLLASGGTTSLNRLAYGIVSISLALGILLSRYPRWGYATIGFFTLLLASFAVRFSQHLWVA